MKESQGNPQESSCCYVSVTADGVGGIVKAIVSARLVMGGSLLLKCSPWLFMAFGEPFQLGQTHMKMLSVAVIFQAEMLRKCILEE